MKISKVSESFPALTKFSNAVLSATLPEAEFKWSSLQCNYNYAAKRHVDGNNLGPSYIMALGEHTGGGLWTEDRVSTWYPGLPAIMVSMSCFVASAADTSRGVLRSSPCVGRASW